MDSRLLRDRGRVRSDTNGSLSQFPPLIYSHTEPMTSSLVSLPLTPDDDQGEGTLKYLTKDEQSSECEEDTGDDRKPCPCIQKPEPVDAWVALAAGLIVNMCIASEISSFALYYVEYTHLFDLPKVSVGWIKGIQTITGAVISIFASPFIKRYGCRSVVVVSGSCFSAGMFLGTFAPNIYVSYVTNGILLGIGTTMANMCVAVCLQQHFIRNKVLGVGVASIGFSVGGICSPMIVSRLLESFGLRGTMLIHSAILAHVIACGLIMRSPKSPGPSCEVPERPSMKEFQRDLFDVSLFRNPTFVVLMVATLFVQYTLGTFNSHYFGRAVFTGMSRSSAAYLQSSVSVASCTARIICTFLANFQAVNKVLALGCSLLLFSLGSFLNGFFTTPSLMLMTGVLFGMGVGAMSTVLTAAFVDLFTLTRLPKVIGFYNISVHIGLTLGPPISGLIFDVTGNYNIPFYLSGTLSMLGSVIVIIIAGGNIHKTRKARTRRQISTMQNC